VQVTLKKPTQERTLSIVHSMYLHPWEGSSPSPKNDTKMKNKNETESMEMKMVGADKNGNAIKWTIEFCCRKISVKFMIHINSSFYIFSTPD
jgi:hypothetical protein